MSNRRKLRPPAQFRTYARNYQCQDCNSEVRMKPAGGAWRMQVMHDEGCPVLTGVVSTRAAGVKAAEAVAAAHGGPVLYVHDDA